MTKYTSKFKVSTQIPPTYLTLPCYHLSSITVATKELSYIYLLKNAAKAKKLFLPFEG